MRAVFGNTMLLVAFWWEKRIDLPQVTTLGLQTW